MFDVALAQHMANDLNALAQTQPEDIHGYAQAYIESCAKSLTRSGLVTVTDRLMYVEREQPYMGTLCYDRQARLFAVRSPLDVMGS